jgi:oxalate decarboxylase
MLIGLNAGVYEKITPAEWMAGNPPDLLTTNSGKPASLFIKFPHKDTFIDH